MLLGAQPRLLCLLGAIHTVTLFSLWSVMTLCYFPHHRAFAPAFPSVWNVLSWLYEARSFSFNLKLKWTPSPLPLPPTPVILSCFLIFPFMALITVCTYAHICLFSFLPLASPSRLGVSKLWPMGQIWPTTCFCMAHELRMVLVFKWLKKKNQKNNISTTQEDHMKFKFQCPAMKFCGYT